MNKDFKILAEAYDQIVQNQFDIGTKNIPPGGLKTEAGIPVLRSCIKVYVEAENEEELIQYQELLKNYIDEQRKTTDWLDRDQDFEREPEVQ